MTESTSRIPGFHRLSRTDRLKEVQTLAALDDALLQSLADAGAALGEVADHLSENVIGTMNVPLGIATNMIVDGAEVLVPMATEESSVIAAVCNGARQCRATGGVTTSTTGPMMIAQVQVTGLSDPLHARAITFERQAEIQTVCDEADPVLLKLGGGLKDIEPRVLDALPGTLVVHLVVDTRDAMGANAVNTMAEAVAPLLAEWTGGRPGLRILSNLADRRLVRTRAVFAPDEIGGEEVRDSIVAAGQFALADPYRATTHNKGIMNGVSAVVLATGNDTRAVEAGAHAYAARTGAYLPLTRWEVTGGGSLAGTLEMPLGVGLVGGATKAHPTAQAVMRIMGVDSADRLSRIAGAVGLVQNFAALKVLATEGVQRGHMALHAQNVAMMAGAVGEEIDRVASALVEKGQVRVDVAEAVLKQIRGES